MRIIRRYSRVWLAAALVLLLVGMPTVRARAQDEQEYVAGEVLVKLFSGANLPAIAAEFGLDPTPLDQFGTRPIYRLRIADSVMPPEKVAALTGDSRIEFAEPNFVAQTPEGRKRSPWGGGGNSGDYADQWVPGAIRLDEAHMVSRGAGIAVAVLDTGVDASHPALAGQLRAGFDFVDFDADPREEGSTANFGYGHGTHVAGLVALAAPDVQIIPVRVLDQDGVGNIWVLAEGLAYAVDPDANPTTDDGARVINLSLGTFRPTNLLAEIIAEVTCANYDDDDDDDEDTGNALCRRTGGALVVAAAGNQGNSTAHYPAAENVAGSLAVAASTADNTLALFSNYGPWVQIAAPGENVSSSVPGGEYAVWSGTSMAAPLVAGIAALVRAADAELPATDVADQIINAGGALCDTTLPLIDAAAALGQPAATAETCANVQP